MSSVPAPTASTLKEKTKAKQRYLKQKKKRRKLRKSNANDQTNDTRNEHGREDGDDEGSDASSIISHHETVKVLRQDALRPKKRRRVTEEILDKAENAMPQLLLAETERSPQDGFLSSFPVPPPSDAPSASVLAFQGIDKALINAVRIHPTAQLPISQGKDDDGVTGLSLKTRRRLSELGITDLFAVQATLLPFLLFSDPLKRVSNSIYEPPCDICVSAPTGSGKTLAYVLPIVEILSARIITRLRALVVLPTRDLVVQVRETFEVLGKGRGLKIAAVTGQHSFTHEQSQLIADKISNIQGSSSKIDILICTPGRLIDHINNTPNFSLQHLRFLVIDEADRLLTQSFQGWLAQVLSSIRQAPLCALSRPVEQPYAPDAVALQIEHILPYPDIPPLYGEKKVSSCQKLLFSATLTRDPGKIAALSLRSPKYLVVHGNQDPIGELGALDIVTEKFAMPGSLAEHMIICESMQKPLVFFYLLHTQHITNALIFTKSAESTTRLLNLLIFFEESLAVAGSSTAERFSASAYSSDLAVGERKMILEKFKSQRLDLLICSDLISRGIDISHVSHVISYDAPVDMRKYVHRAGRTARAGKEGDAWVLVEEQEARYFKTMMRNANHLTQLQRMRISKEQLNPFLTAYDMALARLKDLYSR